MNSSTDMGQVHDGTAGGKMILVCSAVGGAGKTTVTVNLAALLAERTIRTAILDADLQFGDLALALDVVPFITIKEAAEQNGLNRIGSYCIQHKSGIRLLAAPVRPEFAELITADVLVGAIAALRAESDVLLVETVHGLTDQNLILMDQADSILIVTTPGMAALKNTRLMIETLTALGMRDKIQLVVNKSDAPTIMDISDIPELMQLQNVSRLPYDSKRISFAMDSGVPLIVSHPLHGFSKQMKKLADLLFQPEIPTSEGMLERIRKKVTATRRKEEQDEFVSEAAIEKFGRSDHS